MCLHIYIKLKHTQKKIQETESLSCIPETNTTLSSTTKATVTTNLPGGTGGGKPGNWGGGIPGGSAGIPIGGRFK